LASINIEQTWELIASLSSKGEDMNSTIEVSIDGTNIRDCLYKKFCNQPPIEIEIEHEKINLNIEYNPIMISVFSASNVRKLQNILKDNIIILPRDDGLLAITNTLQQLQDRIHSYPLQVIEDLALHQYDSVLPQKWLDCEVSLSTVLQKLRHDNGLLTELNKLAMEFHQVEFYFEGNAILFKKSGKSFSLDSASGTVLHSLSLFYVMCNKTCGTLLLDEPASMWHPSVHLQLVHKLVSITKGKSMLAITHSPSLVAFEKSTRIIRFSRELDHTQIHQIIPESLDLLKFIEVRNALFARFVVLVEGPTESNFFSQLQQYDSTYRSVLQSVFFLRLDGCGQFKKVSKLLDDARIPWIALLDSDKLDGIARKNSASDEILKMEINKLSSTSKLVLASSRDEAIIRQFPLIKEYCENLPDRNSRIVLQPKIVQPIKDLIYNQNSEQVTANSNIEKLNDDIIALITSRFPRFDVSTILHTEKLKEELVRDFTTQDSNDFQLLLRKLCADKFNIWVWDNCRNGAIESALNTTKDGNIPGINEVLHNISIYPQLKGFLDYLQAQYLTWKFNGQLKNHLTVGDIIQIVSSPEFGTAEDVQIAGDWSNWCPQKMHYDYAKLRFVAYIIIQAGSCYQ
jgi:hypothetical protein